jgi:hypothetical protein
MKKGTPGIHQAGWSKDVRCELTELTVGDGGPFCYGTFTVELSDLFCIPPRGAARGIGADICCYCPHCDRELKIICGAVVSTDPPIPSRQNFLEKQESE